MNILLPHSALSVITMNLRSPTIAHFHGKISNPCSTPTAEILASPLNSNPQFETNDSVAFGNSTHNNFYGILNVCMSVEVILCNYFASLMYVCI